MDQPAVPNLLSRAEVLRGLPARRASTLLYAIECRTAQRMVRTRQATARLANERTAEQQERVFLDALAKGRELPIRPSIQEVERYAADWAMLVPDDPAVRAALGALVGNKYAFRHKDVPRLRGVLGLDTAQVVDAYTRQHGAPLARIFATRTSWRELRRAQYGGSSVFAANYADQGRQFIREIDFGSSLGSRRTLFENFDASGRESARREFVDGVAGSPTFSQYDALGRLASVQSMGATPTSWQFSYDALGNIRKLTDFLGNTNRHG